VACDWIIRECGMAWSGAGLGFQWCLGREDVGILVNGIDADEVGSEIRDEEVLLGGVEDCLV
jgi:hypothetical protein